MSKVYVHIFDNLAVNTDLGWGGVCLCFAHVFVFVYMYVYVYAHCTHMNTCKIHVHILDYSTIGADLVYERV